MLPNTTELERIVGITLNVERELRKAIDERRTRLDAAAARELAELNIALSGLLATHLDDIQTEIAGSAAPSSGRASQPGSLQQPS